MRGFLVSSFPIPNGSLDLAASLAGELLAPLVLALGVTIAARVPAVPARVASPAAPVLGVGLVHGVHFSSLGRVPFDDSIIP